MDLLERDAKLLGELLLAQVQHLAPDADHIADMAVDRIRAPRAVTLVSGQFWPPLFRLENQDSARSTRICCKFADDSTGTIG
ncbi:MAG TPA: hypothetical protein VHG92_12265 [Afifellaceae bacterium]|nr:hypothetical protein [Afifellaceae bacterium]